MKRFGFFLLCLLLVAALAGCGTDAPRPTMDSGTIQDDVFSNDYFRVCLDIGGRWNVETEIPRAEYFLSSLEALLGEGHVDFFYIVDKDAGNDQYPSMFMFARSMDSMEAYVETASDYLSAAQFELETTYSSAVFDPIEKQSLSGKEFYYLNGVVTTDDDDVIYHSVLGRVEDEYMLIIGISYLDFTQQEEIFAKLHQIEFN